MLAGVRGIGTWTAQMFLMFQLLRLDVWPTGDLGVRKGFGLAWGMPMLNAGSNWRRSANRTGPTVRSWRGTAGAPPSSTAARRKSALTLLARAAGMPGPRSLFCLQMVLLAGRNCFWAWHGRGRFSLICNILGSYFAPVKDAVAAQQRHGHGPITVETSGFVFQQGGHARSFHGRAYVAVNGATGRRCH